MRLKIKFNKQFKRLEEGVKMAIKLITGLKTTTDIESQDDGARIYGTISSGDRVLNAGSRWAYQVISNNLVRIKDGELLMQGRHVRQAPNTYTDLTINNGTQGLKRNDIIVARYTKNSNTGIENVGLAVLQGTPGSTATDPTITTGDIFVGCEIHEMVLYRIFLNGLNIESVTALFSTMPTLDNVYPIGSIYMSVSSTNPSVFFGGMWVAWGTGRVPVGIDISDTNFNVSEKTGGEKTHALTIAEMPSHTHSYGGVTTFGPTSPASSYTVSTPYSGVTGQTGGNSAHNNLQPYITCYMWKRTQ